MRRLAQPRTSRILLLSRRDFLQICSSLNQLLLNIQTSRNRVQRLTAQQSTWFYQQSSCLRFRGIEHRDKKIWFMSWETSGVKSALALKCSRFDVDLPEKFRDTSIVVNIAPCARSQRVNIVSKHVSENRNGKVDCSKMADGSMCLEWLNVAYTFTNLWCQLTHYITKQPIREEICRPWVSFLRWISSSTRPFLVCASWMPRWTVAVEEINIWFQ